MTSVPRPCWAFTLALVLILSLSSSSLVGEQGSELGVEVFRLAAATQPNLLVSPHGVAGVLGLLLPGAGGNTREQMLTALRYEDGGDLYEALGDLHGSLEKSGQGAVVSVSNGLFLQRGLLMDESFRSTVKSTFGCETKEVNFNFSVSTAGEINAWIRDRTNEKITELVSADMLDGSNTRLVAVNAVYFKGQWKNRFRLKETKRANFTTADGSKHEVSMMTQVSVFNTGTAFTRAGLPYTVIELPYQRDNFSMLIVMPPEDTPLADLLPKVDMATVRSWLDCLSPSQIQLSLPRFSVESKLDLKVPLSELRVTDLFHQHRADLSHISSVSLYVSKAIQKAKMEVNEDGTEAAVATAVVMLSRSSTLPVTVDRPFLFLIRHRSTGTLLFMGQINKPYDPWYKPEDPSNEPK